MSTHQTLLAPDPIDALLSAHGLRRTAAARRVLGWLLAHPDTSYTHAQLQAALQADSCATVASAEASKPLLGTAAAAPLALDRVTLYRLIDRLTQVGLLLCRVDAQRVRRYQAMPESVRAMPHFECQSCHRDSPLTGALQGNAQDLELAAQNALQALKALGYQGLSLDLAVRGVCADCATAAQEGHVAAATVKLRQPAQATQMQPDQPLNSVGTTANVVISAT